MKKEYEMPKIELISFEAEEEINAGDFEVVSSGQGTGRI